MELKIEKYFPAPEGANGFSLESRDLTEQDVEEGRYLEVIQELDAWRDKDRGRSWRADFQYPVAEKVRSVSERSNEIGRFLDWLNEERGISLVVLDEGDWRYLSQTTQQLLADYFEIDLNEYEKERSHMLAVQRVNNERFAEANRRKT